MTEKFNTDITEAEDIQRLPSELDNDGVVFSYGSLLDHEMLRRLLKGRGPFRIMETGDAAEAVDLVRGGPGDIVILRNVRLENVRVSIVTETILRRRYKDSGGDLQELIDAGVTTREVPQAAYLYARPAAPFEKGRSLNGGLICNLTEEELSVLDMYEFEPVLRRTRAPELTIRGRSYVPEHITFYAGSGSSGDLTVEEKAERSRLLNLNRKPGRQSPQAKWPTNVRRK